MSDLHEANRHFVAKDYARAVDLYLRHAEKCPSDSSRSYASIAECLLRSNSLIAPVAIAPGIVLVSQGDRRGAEHYFRLAIMADPMNTEAIWGLSELLPESSAERGELLEKSVAVLPRTLNLIALGDFHRTHTKNLDRAYSIYKLAQEHAPRDQTAYLRLNDVCRRLGRPDEAKNWSERWKQAKASRRRVDGKG